MLKHMGVMDDIIVGILFIMSIWSLAVMIDRAPVLCSRKEAVA